VLLIMAYSIEIISRLWSKQVPMMWWVLS